MGLGLNETVLLQDFFDGATAPWGEGQELSGQIQVKMVECRFGTDLLFVPHPPVCLFPRIDHFLGFPDDLISNSIGKSVAVHHDRFGMDGCTGHDDFFAIEHQTLGFNSHSRAQTTLRNVIGQMNLDDLLAKRHDVAERIKNDLDAAVSDWGVDVMRLELQDISLPDNMKRVMARQAEAEREKRGVIIASEGELAAAENLAKASDVLSTSEYGFALRQLSTLSDVSQDQSNTVVFYPTSALNPEGMLAAGLAARIPKPTDPNGKKRGGKEKED